MLPAQLWNAITELSLLFRCLCSAMLDVSKVRELVAKVPVITCNLEKVFPPSFFNSMEHVVVHLLLEALIGGPVQFRWIYVFERYIYTQQTILTKILALCNGSTYFCT